MQVADAELTPSRKLEARILKLNSQLSIAGYVIAGCLPARLAWRYFHQMQQLPGITGTVGAERVLLIGALPLYIALSLLSTIRFGFLFKHGLDWLMARRHGQQEK